VEGGRSCQEAPLIQRWVMRQRPGCGCWEPETDSRGHVIVCSGWQHGDGLLSYSLLSNEILWALVFVTTRCSDVFVTSLSNGYYSLINSILHSQKVLTCLFYVYCTIVILPVCHCYVIIIDCLLTSFDILYFSTNGCINKSLTYLLTYSRTSKVLIMMTSVVITAAVLHHTPHQASHNDINYAAQ